MKFLFILWTALMLSFTTHAQQKTGWKEMDSFHALSNQCLHTAMAGNFQPVKTNVDALLAAAKSWQQSKAPKGSDTSKYKGDLDALVKQCQLLADAIKTGKPDAEVRTLANQAHATFHVLMAETIINP